VTASLIGRKVGSPECDSLQIRFIRICAMSELRLLSDLNPGDHGVIAAVHAPEGLGKRLTALGFSTGRPLRLVRRALLAGPLHVRLGTTDVALRMAEAAGIQVRVAAPGPA